MKKVSVIVPVYNTEKYLKECLNSILSQSYSDFEIIVVNDGSTDNSFSIISEFSKNDNRIKVVDKPNGGLSSARNEGLKIATGDYIMFVDSDDTILKDALKIAVKSIEKSNADVCMFSHFLLRGEEKQKREVCLLGEFDKTKIKEEIIPKFLGQNKGEKPIFAFVWAQIFKREYIGENPFLSEREYYMEDLLYDLDYYKKANKAVFISDALYNYRIVDGSLTNTYRENLFDKFNLLLNYLWTYMVNNGYEKEERRLLYRAFRLSIAGIKNINKSRKNKAQKIECIKKVVKNEFVSKSLSLPQTGIKNKIFKFLLKHKLYSFLLRV